TCCAAAMSKPAPWSTRPGCWRSSARPFWGCLPARKRRSGSWACSRPASRCATKEETGMTRQVQDAYIVAATRSPIGRAPRGALRHYRPDDLLAHVIRALLAQVPSLDPAAIEDAIVSCAMPEGSQGLNVARLGVLLAGLPASVGGVTVNRFCASGLTAIAMAADRIRVGEADVIIAAGTESMSQNPPMGANPSFSPQIYAHDENLGIAFGMG